MSRNVPQPSSLVPYEDGRDPREVGIEYVIDACNSWKDTKPETAVQDHALIGIGFLLAALVDEIRAAHAEAAR